MIFYDLGEAFARMEQAVAETGRTHLLMHSSTRSKKYRVIERHGHAIPKYIIAELNYRNMKGDETMQRVVARARAKGKRHYVR